MVFVVDFRLPFDPLFVHHGTNCCARNAREACEAVKKGIPDAQRVTARPGMVCCYGKPWSTWDSTLGAECAPVERQE